MKVRNNLIDMSLLYLWARKNNRSINYWKWTAVVATGFATLYLVPPENIRIMVLTFCMGIGLGLVLHAACIGISLILMLLLNVMKYGFYSEYILTMEDRGILVDSHKEQRGIWWDSIKQIGKTENGIFIAFGRSSTEYLVIPRRLFPNDSKYADYHLSLSQRSVKMRSEKVNMES